MNPTLWLFSEDALRLVAKGYGATEATESVLASARIAGRRLTAAERDAITERVDDRAAALIEGS